MQRIAQVGLGKLSILATIVCVFCVLTVFGQNMFSSGPLSEQNPRKVARGGVSSHAEIASCSACHAPAWSSESMATRCMDCHDNIRAQIDGGKAMHGLVENASDCRTCHTEHKGPHGTLTTLAHFDHDCAAFKLTGKHRQVECNACHQGKPFQGTPQACVACHAEPDAHKGKFGLDCMSCHSTQTWQTTGFKTNLFTSAKFDHASTGFALIGKHAITDCKSCHKGDAGVAFKGLSQSCVSCHGEPDIHKGKFGLDCKSCHSTTDWKSIGFKKEVFTSIGFNHDTTAFKLTGKHATTDCKSCHTGNTFKGTPTACVSCHAEPTNHKPHPKYFGTNCVQCHSTVSWAGATLVKHTFPMDHRTKNGKNSACIVCHKDTMNTFTSTATTPGLSYATYTCYGCHAHTPQREALRHVNRRGVTELNLNKCATCHKSPRNNRKRAAVDEMLDFTASCPETAPSTTSCPSFGVEAVQPRLVLSNVAHAPAETHFTRHAPSPLPTHDLTAKLGLHRFDLREIGALLR